MEGHADMPGSSPSHAPTLSERRLHDRQHANWAATCRVDGGEPFETTVVDVSLGGLGLAPCPALDVDDVVLVDLDHIGQFRCRVAWVRDGACGVEFMMQHEEVESAATAALAVSLMDLFHEPA